MNMCWLINKIGSLIQFLRSSNLGSEMKKILFILIAIVSFNAVAQEEPKDKKLVELVNVLDMDSMLESMYSQMEVMMQNMATEMGVSPSEQPIFDEYYSKMTLLMRETMSWEKIEPEVIRLYERNFSEEEIDGMLAFYKSEAGQAILKKMPVVMNESMQLGHNLMKETIPQLQEISRQLSDDLEEFRSSQSSKN